MMPSISAATAPPQWRGCGTGSIVPIAASRWTSLLIGLFADVVTKFCIPRELPEALLEGLAWDAEARRYETLQDLTAYAARVAGAVGAMMTLVMGQRSPEIVARACDLGVAMQFTNIARDVGEDARAGRLYLPLSWLREAGIDPDAWLATPSFTPEIAAIVQRLLDAADAFYARATLGIASLPIGCRPGIYAARALYAEIGRELERERAGFCFEACGGLDQSQARRAGADAALAGNGMGACAKVRRPYRSSKRPVSWSRPWRQRRCARTPSRGGRSRIAWSG